MLMQMPGAPGRLPLSLGAASTVHACGRVEAAMGPASTPCQPLAVQSPNVLSMSGCTRASSCLACCGSRTALEVATSLSASAALPSMPMPSSACGAPASSSLLSCATSYACLGMAIPSPAAAASELMLCWLQCWPCCSCEAPPSESDCLVPMQALPVAVSSHSGFWCCMCRLFFS